MAMDSYPDQSEIEKEDISGDELKESSSSSEEDDDQPE